MTDDVKALVAELREDHYWVDGECGNRDCRAYAWPCPAGEAAEALEAQQRRIEELERVRPRPELVAEIRANHTRYEHIAFCRCGARWPCYGENAADAIEGLQRRIELLERVAEAARFWCDEADCVPMAVEDALIALDSLS